MSLVNLATRMGAAKSNPWCRWLVALDPRRRFRMRLGLAIASVTLSFSLLLSWVVGSVSIAQNKSHRGELMAQLADQIAQRLDQGMYTYFREIQFLASLNEIQDPNQPLAAKRSALEDLKRTYPGYAWIGLTDDQGKVIASVESILEGVDVSERSWFVEGQKNITVQDVHEAHLLAAKVPNPNPDEPVRFVNISAPVFNREGTFQGVLGAHLYWEWTSKIRDVLQQPLQINHQVEVRIISASEEVLLAANKGKATLQMKESFQLAQQGKTGYQVETGTDSRSYLVGFAPTQGYRSYPGLGWVVLVRQPTTIAFAEARSLQHKILRWGIVLGIISIAISWWVSGRLSTPLVAIATAADKIRRDESVKIPIISGLDEVAILSRSISSLVCTLKEQQDALKTLNSELELRVAARTASLKRLNKKLETEVKIRRLAEASLAQANSDLKRLATVDSLTGVANRRHFDEYLAQEWKRLAREHSPLSLILCDVDYFKAYNDTYGHQAGDQCLQAVAEAIRGTLKRPADLVARYGGEEMVVVLPNTDRQGAIHVAEAIRAALRALQIPHRGSTVSEYVTLSCGVATAVPMPHSAPQALIAQADHHLYQAKQGRDRVVG